MTRELTSRRRRFFGVADPDRWREIWLKPLVSFRRWPTLAADPGAVATWLRLGEFEAMTLETEPFGGRRFREALTAIRTLTLRDAVPALKALGASALRPGRRCLPFGYRQDANERRRPLADAVMIPRRYESRFDQLHMDSDVRRLARELGVAPGVVVGRLQREGKWGWHRGNHLKAKISFDDLLV